MTEQEMHHDVCCNFKTVIHHGLIGLTSLHSVAQCLIRSCYGSKQILAIHRAWKIIDIEHCSMSMERCRKAVSTVSSRLFFPFIVRPSESRPYGLVIVKGLGFVWGFQKATLWPSNSIGLWVCVGFQKAAIWPSNSIGLWVCVGFSESHPMA